MRVLQLIETGGPGGAETVFAQLATGLRESGHDVHCLIGEGSWLPGEMARRGFSPELMARGTSVASTLQRLHTLIRREGIDVVHAHLFDGAIYGALAARWCGVPIIATLHGQVDVRQGGLKAFVKQRAFRYGVTHAVAVSHALKRDLQPALSFPDDRFTVVHNGIERCDVMAHVPAPQPPPFRIVAVGNIRPAKDYPTLLTAVARLRDRGIHIVADIVGQPDTSGLFEQLLDMRAALGLHEVVTFLGFQSDIRSILASAHVFVLASSQEGFSLATIEAMQAGVAVVATRSGGPEEIIRHGETGLLVPTGDPEALASTIETLLTDGVQRARLAAAGQHDTSRRFGIPQMVHNYLSLYEACLRVE